MEKREEHEDCRARKEHGQSTEPRFTITLPQDKAADVYGDLLGEDEKNPGDTG